MRSAVIGGGRRSSPLPPRLKVKRPTFAAAHTHCYRVEASGGQTVWRLPGHLKAAVCEMDSSPADTN